MANILQTINNFVTVSYDYLIDVTNNISKHANINSNTAPLNITSAGNYIQTNSSIQYSYTVDPAHQAKTTIVNSATVQTIFGALASLSNSQKYSNAKYADVGDNISYAIQIVNNGNVDANDVVFSDTLPQGVTFVSGSLMLDGLPVTNPNINPVTGFNVGTVPAGMTRVVTFNVNITSIPSTNQITNIAQFAYDFLINPGDTTSKQNATDTTGTAIITTIAHADLSTTKETVDKSAASIGDILTYTTTIPNTGNADATNVIFTEPIPSKSQLVPGSIVATVNNNPISINSGSLTDTMITANLGIIQPGQQAVVTFKVKIIK